MLVEELLQFLVDIVDTDLLEAVVLKDLKTSDIQDGTEIGLLQSWVNKSVITLLNQPLEDTVKDGPSNAANSVGSLLASLGSRNT